MNSILVGCNPQHSNKRNNPTNTLHGYVRLSVCLSVCLSVRHTFNEQVQVTHVLRGALHSSLKTTFMNQNRNVLTPCMLRLAVYK